MLKRIIKFILIVLWMLIIFIFSSDNSLESTKKSNSVITTVAEVILRRSLTPNEKETYIDKFVVITRKGAHFTVYLILGILLLNFIKEFKPINYKSIFIAISLAFLYASTDEFHQLFVPGRSGEVKDILIDTIGASTGCFIFYIIHNIRRKIHE